MFSCSGCESKSMTMKRPLPMRTRTFLIAAAAPLLGLGAYLALAQESKSPTPGRDVKTGKAAFADFSQQKPGIFRKITLADLPQPFETESAFNMPSVVARPE